MKLNILIICFFCSFNSLANSWVYEQKKDGFNDKSGHTAYIKGKGGTYALAQCDSNSVFNVQFFINEYLSRKAVNVKWRIDNGEVNTGAWNVSTEGTTVFARSDVKNQLGRKMRSGSNILLEVTDYRGTNHRVKFSLRGSSKAISSIYKACDISMEVMKFDGVGDVVSNYIDRMGPKSTICFSKKLALNNYKISEFSNIKSEELYQQAQIFLDNKMKLCPSGNYFISRGCNDPKEFFFDLYVVASKKDAAIKRECGSLKLEL